MRNYGDLVSKKRQENKKRLFRFLLIFLILLVLIIVLISFFYYKNCENQECFDEQLKKCNHARFIHRGDMIFEYRINGEKNGKCIVDVKLLEGDLNNMDSLKLVGREMSCYIPLGAVIKPESDIENCHGMLKEGLQELIISKLHTYIVQNLGRINSELLEGI